MNGTTPTTGSENWIAHQRRQNWKGAQTLEYTDELTRKKNMISKFLWGHESTSQIRRTWINRPEICSEEGSESQIAKDYF